MNRHGRDAQSGPAYATPTRGVTDTSSGRTVSARIGRVALEPERRGGVAQVAPGPGRVDAERGGDETGSAREANVGCPVEALARSSQTIGRARRPTPSLDREAIAAHLAESGERLDGTDQHGARGALRARHDVQAVVHPVDKVHVGDARLDRP